MATLAQAFQWVWGGTVC